mmetsp:Transcript_80937/g.229209  ORF Transcript_80937/g.229209 Transcript_80937/m.229209 type:complete len:222 (-) Transcript_80937:945-1610(-)
MQLLNAMLVPQAVVHDPPTYPIRQHTHRHEAAIVFKLELRKCRYFPLAALLRAPPHGLVNQHWHDPMRKLGCLESSEVVEMCHLTLDRFRQLSWLAYGPVRGQAFRDLLEAALRNQHYALRPISSPEPEAIHVRHLPRVELPIGAVRDHEHAEGLERERQREEAREVKPWLRQGWRLVEDVVSNEGRHKIEQPHVENGDVQIDVEVHRNDDDEPDSNRTRT